MRPRRRSPPSSSLLDIGIGIAQPCAIGGSRPRVQLGEQRVVERARLALADGAVWIMQVAENDRLGRTGRLTGGDDLAVAYAAVLAIGGDSGGADPLEAIGAFLHDAPRPHGDIRVARFRRPRLFLGVSEEVEPPDLVGAIVRAEPRADAAIVDHDVQALMIVVRRLDRADDLAGRVLAMHAQDGLEQRVGSIEPALVIAI